MMIITSEEIRHALRHGTGFDNGKFRVMRLYELPTDEKDLAKALASEYGIGGHSHTYLCGTNGFVEYDSKGFYMRWDHFTQSYNIPWIKAARIIRWMIDNHDYLTGSEPEQYAAWKAENNNPVPFSMSVLKNHEDAAEIIQPPAEAVARSVTDEGGVVDDILQLGQITFDELLGGM